MYTLSQHIKHRLLFIRLALLGFLMLIATAAMAQGGGSTPHVTIGGSVFGGGNLADVGRNSTVTIDQANATMTDVYGGGALANVGTSADDTTTVNILQGHISGNVYGGGLGDSTATGYDGNANVAALVHGKVFVNIGAAPVAPNTTPTGNAIINGSVFGCNNINGTPLDSVFVNIYKTAHTTENTYPTAPSGGWTATELAYNALTQEYALAAVYGGGNKASYKPSVAGRATTVHIYYCQENTIQTAYGGGNAADVGTSSKNANTRLIIDGGRFDLIFGGGNGYSSSGNHNDPTQANYNPGANIYGTATTEINAGLYNQIFGGSNQYGTISTVSLNIDKDPDCDEMILESFCGGNEADMVGTDVNTTILCGDIRIGTLYGGSNKADIKKDNLGNGGNVTLTVFGGNYDYVFGGSKGTLPPDNPSPAQLAAASADIEGNVTLNLHGGTIHEAAFGGSDVNGNILGSITVNVLDTVNSCPLAVDTIYGGGRDAAYTPTIASSISPAVNIQHCTVDCVFGAGKGTTATVTANPRVVIGETNTINGPNGQPISTEATVNGDVYGGGDAADVAGTTTVIVQKCNSSAKYVYGGGNAADVTGTQVYIRGGEIDTIFGGGHGNNDPNHLAVANVNGNDTIAITGGKVGKAFAGGNLNGTINGRMSLNVAKSDPATCDLMVGEVYGGGNQAAGNAGTITIGCTGTWTTTGTNNHTNHNTTDNRIGYELEGVGTVYGGANQADIGTNGNPSNIVLTIKDGIVENVYGGNNTSGDIHGTITVNIEKTSDACGWYVGDVFGGGNVADYGGTPDVNIIAGIVSGSVFGGGNAADVAGSDVEVRGGQINGGVYGGCNAEGNTGPVVISLNGGQIGADANHTADVFGGGFGAATTTSENIKVTLSGTTVYGDLYGGSALGSVNATASNGDTITISSNTLHGTIYGGGKGSNEGSGTTALTNGNVVINYNTANTGLAGLYGGANVNGNVKGNIEVNVNANVGTTGTGNSRDIFGGGYGAATNTDGSVTVTIGDLSGTKTPVIYGDIYGGSALGNVNDAAADLTKVDFLNGTLHGNIFGGGLGDKATLGTGHSDVAAKVNGEVQVNVSSATQTEAQCHIDLRGASIYGCNNTNGSPQADVTVNIWKTDHMATDSATYVGSAPGTLTYAIDQVFGGGKNADYLPGAGATNSSKVAKVYVHGCDNTIRRIFSGGDAAASTGVAATIDGGRFDYIFGGGNGEVTEANIGLGGTNLIVHAGIINYLFGGSNTRGTISGSMITTIDNDSGCTEEIGEFFGGGNLAPISTSITTTLNCGVGTFDAVYGGSNAADITGDVTLTIKGGTITNVFGGSKGVQNGTSANITGNVTLNILSGTVQQAFGGSNYNGNITGKITVNVLDTVASCQLQLDTVYGSGNLTPYTPTTASILSPEVNVLKGTVNDVVFGGGKGTTAVVTANPKVTIGDLANTDYVAIVNGKVFGGGNAAAVQGNTSVLIQQSYSEADTIFGGGNLANVSGATTVNVNGGTVHYDVYGGGALANTGGSTVTLGGGTVRDLYGGGLGDNSHPAAVNGAVTVNVNSGTVANVFGCNNVNGAPTSTVQVNINNNVTTNVFGGGNLAAYTGTPEVNITAGTVGGSVFGGGNEAGVGGGDVNVIGGQINTGVYGGCNTSGTVSGDITVNVKSGVIGTQANLNNNILANVFGGGFGQETTTSGNVTVNFGNRPTTPSAPNANLKLYGDIYGGSALGSVNTNGNNTTMVNVLDGTLFSKTDTLDIMVNNVATGRKHVVYTGGNVFGGGLGEVGYPARGQVNGKIVVNIGAPKTTRNLDPVNDTCVGNATIGGNVYGCNNTSGSPQDDVEVNIYRTYRRNTDEVNIGISDPTVTYAIANVFGGGNKANYTATGKTATVNILSCYNTIRRVFGGGNAAAAPNVHTNIQGGRFAEVFGGGNGEVSAANITGNVDLEIHGGEVGEFFVGSNQNGTISGLSSVSVDQSSGCEEIYITEFYCGGKYADVEGSIEATITCSEGLHVTDLYGGCKEADVKKKNGTGGNVHLSVYGGLYTNVYGGSRGKLGGKAANIEGNVTLDLYGGTMVNVYGGSNENGNIDGNITVNVIDNEDPDCPLYITNIYGGSNLTDYEPTNASAISPVVNVVHINSGVQGCIYGGSRGDVNASTPTLLRANPQVNIGYDASMTGLPPTATYDPADYSQKAIVRGSVFGGGDAAKIEGSTLIFLRNRAKVFGNVYGGGNLGEVSGNTRVIVNGQNQ